MRMLTVNRNPTACRTYDSGVDCWLDARATVNSDGRLAVNECNPNGGISREIAHYNVGMWVMYYYTDVPANEATEDAKPGY